MMKTDIIPSALKAVAIAAVVAVLALPGAVRASTLPLTLEQMVAVADQIVTVRVSKTTSELAAGKITTTTDLEVIESFKGNMEGSAEITTLGGRWGAVVMEVPNVPKFQKGEESVLFLSRPVDRLPESSKAGYDLDSPLIQSYQVIGGHQGKFRLVGSEGQPNTGERKADDEIPNNLKVTRQVSAAASKSADSPSYNQFKDAVKSLVGAQQQKAASKAEKEPIAGIMGKFHIPERSANKAVRYFDPLPSMAYASDEELKSMEKSMQDAIKARQADKNGNDDGEEDDQ